MKKINILSPSFQKNELDKLSAHYDDLINLYREDVNEDYSNEHLSADFQSFFKEAIFTEKLDKFSPINWYWLQLIDKIVHVISIHEELVISSDYSMTESEDELFNFWNESDFSKNFLEMINESRNLREVSNFHLLLLENQTIAFFILHIDFFKNQSSNFYNIPELGDGEARVYSTFLNNYITTKSIRDGHIYTLKTDEKDIFINDLKFLRSDNTFSNIISSSVEMDSEIKFIESRIEHALKVIRMISPELHSTYMNFTHKIVPINESGIVSYSMQILPFYSCINTYERDSVDLLDDLLHENGHHYLNVILNTSELINEDDEKIFFSPWRNALRPIRGIYHAYFTFYWAFELFTALSKFVISNESQDIFNEKEINKILYRALEEYKLLTFCHDDLNHAYHEGKITLEGFRLFESVKELIESKADFLVTISELLKFRDEDEFIKIKELSTNLLANKKQYSIQ